MGKAFKALAQNTLNFKLAPISIRELFYLDEAPCDIYGKDDDLFTLLLKKGAFINSNILKELIDKGHVYLYAPLDDRQGLIKSQQENLRQITRSLSIGDPLEKGRKQLNLLSINMHYLYDDPTDDERLNLQYQSAQNLCSFLLKNIDLLNPLYEDYLKQKHHFIYAQPLLSSLFLLGYLKHGHFLNEKDIESLFLASYFKDIGMSAIPTEKYDEEHLSADDKVLLANHPQHSVEILKGRVPLGSNYLTVIENHHMFSTLLGDPREIKDDKNILKGFETLSISLMDAISAMITPRPYRKAKTLYEALEYTKALIMDHHPNEFRSLISFFKSFFLKK